MKWQKLGRIFCADEYMDGYTHSAVPIGIHIEGSIYRIIFSARDTHSRSYPFSLLIDIDRIEILEVSKRPLLSLGSAGQFDDSGVMPTCYVKNGNEIYLYYIGWNLSKTVPFRNALGLAKSTDGGGSFSKQFEGPILDRSIYDPSFVASCDVINIEGKWVMYYLSCLGWEFKEGKWRHFYHIKMAESMNLIDWKRQGKVAFDFSNPEEYAISVPRIQKTKQGFRAWYSYRGKGRVTTYRIGYAESMDGYTWNRLDDLSGIDVSSGEWDGEMICYPFIFVHSGKTLMLYNGNGYGKSGIGLAVLE